HLFDVGGNESDMDHLRTTGGLAHQEGRLLHGVVADGDAQIRAIDRPMDIITFRKRCRAEVKVGAAGHGPLAHPGIAERYPRSSTATRKASRTAAGMEAADTICRVILVNGRIAPTMSTIWKRACRALLIAFWPVIISVGMAPRWA